MKLFVMISYGHVWPLFEFQSYHLLFGICSVNHFIFHNNYALFGFHPIHIYVSRSVHASSSLFIWLATQAIKITSYFTTFMYFNVLLLVISFCILLYVVLTRMKVMIKIPIELHLIIIIYFVFEASTVIVLYKGFRNGIIPSFFIHFSLLCLCLILISVGRITLWDEFFYI